MPVHRRLKSILAAVFAALRQRLPLPDSRPTAAGRERIDREVDTDPAGALSAVKALIESTAKIVLRETGGSWGRNPEFNGLVSDAQKARGLMVGTLAPDKAGDTSLKMVLDGLYKGGHRNRRAPQRHGRDHGRDTPAARPTERHARLAVHSGTAYCRFILDTLIYPAAPGAGSRRGGSRIPCSSRRSSLDE